MLSSLQSKYETPSDKTPDSLQGFPFVSAGRHETQSQILLCMSVLHLLLFLHRCLQWSEAMISHDPFIMLEIQVCQLLCTNQRNTRLKNTIHQDSGCRWVSDSRQFQLIWYDALLLLYGLIFKMTLFSQAELLKAVWRLGINKRLTEAVSMCSFNVFNSAWFGFFCEWSSFLRSAQPTQCRRWWHHTHRPCVILPYYTVSMHGHLPRCETRIADQNRYADVTTVGGERRPWQMSGRWIGWRELMLSIPLMFLCQKFHLLLS